jgi:hypothetical protein
LLQVCFFDKGQDDQLLEWGVDGIRKQIESAQSLAERGRVLYGVRP